MFMSGDFGGQRKRLNSEECFWSQFCSNFGRVGCLIVLLKFPKSVSMHNGYERVQGRWIHEVVSIPVHVNQLDSFRNETRQIRLRVSSHQQSNIVVDRPRRGVKLCVV
ncbi:hypothetical protein TNCV_4631271 [Trichonephila clavipes]|nr:hypothetical protein TNCV_4631271 [Trichonephila clavipes]